jgi:hypothetical protein
LKVTVATPERVPVGALYGLPGFTEPVEQFENLQNQVTTMQQSAQSPFNPAASFQKTDIVLWWELETFWTETLGFSAGTLAYSPEAPYNLLQSPKLKLQGQYTPIECESGFDMAFFQMYRPMRQRGQRNLQDVMQTNFVPTTSFANSLIPQALLAAAILPASLTTPYTVTSYPFILEFPAGMFFDEYWDLALDGSLMPNAQGIAAPQPAFVSPQYMAGGERIIVPSFNIAAGLAGTYDQGPLAATAALTVTSFSGSVTQNARRVAVFASDNPAELPPVFNWQYRRSSRRVPIGAVTKVDIPITEYGQLLSAYVRIFDPSLGSNGVGGYYNVANISKCQLLYGSNLPRFDDDMLAMQKRFIEQHGFLPPQGTMVWDLIASRPSEKITNARALNTLTNANTHFHIENGAAPGANAYAVIGTELLVPVSTQ